MNFKELLKQLNLADEVITNIENSMKDNKIFTTSLENADVRYNKLKEKSEQVENDFKEANKTLEGLKKGHKDIEELQTKINDYEGKMKDLEAKRIADRKELLLTGALEKAKAKDTDYLKYKLGGLDSLELDEQGNIKDLENKIKDLQTNHSALFEIGESVEKEEKPKVIANKLEGNEPPKEVDPFLMGFNS